MQNSFMTQKGHKGLFFGLDCSVFKGIQKFGKIIVQLLVGFVVTDRPMEGTRTPTTI